MILQALVKYYDRKKEFDENSVPEEGLERKEIPFVIVLNEEGRFVDIEDTRSGEGKKKAGRTYIVPHTVKRSVGIKPNLLWDNLGYVLGIDVKGNLERCKKQHKSFVQNIKNKIPNWDSDEGVLAVIRFLEQGDFPGLYNHFLWKELKEFTGNISFRLQKESRLICQREIVLQALSVSSAEETEIRDICMVTGNQDQIARLHSSIKGVWGGQPSGGDIVSFNLDAFSSYGKEQGYNAPIGKKASFAYTTALNHLLAKGSRQRLQVGDATVVFWADKNHPLESVLADLFGEPVKDNPDRHVDAVKAFLESPKAGAKAFDKDETRFYILGLAPNSKRLSVRIWSVNPVRLLSEKIRQHFNDINIQLPQHYPPYPSLFRILTSVAVQGKADNIPPRLGGDVMRSILEGIPYPRTLLSLAVHRTKAEREVSPVRAAVIKACINRDPMTKNNLSKEVAVSLDESNHNEGYLLGRLFAVLEKIQEEANPGINATIRDRFYSSASSSPVAGFPYLMKLKNHHLTKLESRGRAINLEKMICEITDNLKDFPAHLGLADQGRFAIGYYHQRQLLFTKAQDKK